MRTWLRSLSTRKKEIEGKKCYQLVCRRIVLPSLIQRNKREFVLLSEVHHEHVLDSDRINRCYGLSIEILNAVNVVLDNESGPVGGHLSCHDGVHSVIDTHLNGRADGSETSIQVALQESLRQQNARVVP